MNHKLFWLLAGIAACQVSINADPLYVQAPFYAPPSGAYVTAATDYLDIESEGTRTFDDFTLPEPANISAVQWLGFPSDTAPSGNPVPPDFVNWELSFYSTPGSYGTGRLYDAYTTPYAQQVGTTQYQGSTVNVYLFTALVDFSASAGSTYWFSPFAMTTGNQESFEWLGSWAGDYLSAQQNLSVFGSYPPAYATTGDYSFAVYGTPETPVAGSNGISAPEPAALALLALGGAALAGLRRKHRVGPL